MFRKKRGKVFVLCKIFHNKILNIKSVVRLTKENLILMLILLLGQPGCR